MLYNKTMKQAQTYEKRNIYNDRDSSVVFLIALFLPILISLAFTLIANIISATTEIEGDVISSNIWFLACYSVVMGTAYVVLYLLYNKANKIDYRAINFKMKMPWHTYCVVIVLGIIALFGIQYFISMIDNLLVALGYPLNSASTINPTDAGSFIIAIITMAIVPSICEELLFRGVIFQGLRGRFGDLGAVFVSALLFALMHQSFQQLIYPFILGSIMAFVVLRTGSLISSMIVHFINNFLVILLTFLQNTTSFSMALGGWKLYLIGTILLLVTFLIIYLVDKFYFKHKSKDEKSEKIVYAPKLFYIAIGVSILLFLILEITNIVSNT